MMQNPMPIQIQTLISARWVLAMAGQRHVLPYHSVAINAGCIVDVLPTQDAMRAYVAVEYVDLPDHVLLPGLINLHTHAAMSLLRGFADDLPLMQWLQGHIWPAEQRHVAADFVLDGTLLACAESLRAGVTTLNEMYFFPESAAAAVLQAGMRAQIGLPVMEFPTAYAPDVAAYFSQGLQARDNLAGLPGIALAWAPHAPYTVSDASFRQVARWADEFEMPIHCHLHETQQEVQDSLQASGMRPFARLMQLGVLSARWIAVHMVHLNTAEIAEISRLGMHIAHCPSSNMKLASGIAPIHALQGQGVNVGLGTDGAASNNRLDMWGEMRMAALLGKVHGEAEAIPAWAALEMATCNAARALSRGHEIGSLEVGKQADMIAVDLSAPECQPCFDPVSTLIYAAGREHVSHVWVGGRCRLNQRVLTTLDLQDLNARIKQWRDRLRG